MAAPVRHSLAVSYDGSVVYAWTPNGASYKFVSDKGIYRRHMLEEHILAVAWGSKDRWARVVRHWQDLVTLELFKNDAKWETFSLGHISAPWGVVIAWNQSARFVSVASSVSKTMWVVHFPSKRFVTLKGVIAWSMAWMTDTAGEHLVTRGTRGIRVWDIVRTTPVFTISERRQVDASTKAPVVPTESTSTRPHAALLSTGSRSLKCATVLDNGLLDTVIYNITFNRGHWRGRNGINFSIETQAHEFSHVFLRHTIEFVADFVSVRNAAGGDVPCVAVANQDIISIYNADFHVVENGDEGFLVSDGIAGMTWDANRKSIVTLSSDAKTITFHPFLAVLAPIPRKRDDTAAGEALHTLHSIRNLVTVLRTAGGEGLDKLFADVKIQLVTLQLNLAHQADRIESCPHVLKAFTEGMEAIKQIATK